MDAAIGTEKTSSIATRHGAFAAINAGFFRLDNSIWAGIPAGALKIDHEIYGESKNGRTALEILNTNIETLVTIERVNMTCVLEVGDKVFSVGINRERLKDDVVIYTRFFGRTTLTNPDGIEIVVMKNKVFGVFKSVGSTKIPDDGYVISVSGKRVNEFLETLKTGSSLRKRAEYSSAQDGPALNAMSISHDVVGGVPQLLRGGKIEITWEQEKTTKSFVETRHPRTAVAKLKDGKFLMITVDGRSEASGGIGLQDLAEYLLSLGATDAMNLDGGGSTTMFVDGTVVNRPSDKEGERKVSDAILVTLRKQK
ncbi:MAG TPA: phosphodiester glycosidase family protein [Pyrinomonadaceae bacterium]|nr:phosphodiester glycosidase family protein [Pyrinomonadaceae bacterium]